MCQGEWWYLPSLSISPSPPVMAAPFALCKRKEKPFQTHKRQLWHCQAAAQQVSFPRSKRGEGERSPTNQFYKLEVSTSPSLEALLEREVGEEEVKRAEQRNKLGDPTSLHTPPLQDLGRERLFVATVLREEREGREEVTRMAFPPVEQFAITVLVLLHLNSQNYLIKVFLCFFLYLLLCINRHL